MENKPSNTNKQTDWVGVIGKLLLGYLGLSMIKNVASNQIRIEDLEICAVVGSLLWVASQLRRCPPRSAIVRFAYVLGILASMALALAALFLPSLTTYLVILASTLVIVAAVLPRSAQHAIRTLEGGACIIVGIMVIGFTQSDISAAIKIFDYVFGFAVIGMGFGILFNSSLPIFELSLLAVGLTISYLGVIELISGNVPAVGAISGFVGGLFCSASAIYLWRNNMPSFYILIGIGNIGLGMSLLINWLDLFGIWCATLGMAFIGWGISLLNDKHRYIEPISSAIVGLGGVAQVGIGIFYIYKADAFMAAFSILCGMSYVGLALWLLPGLKQYAQQLWNSWTADRTDANQSEGE